MKKILSVLLIAALVLLCGCAGGKTVQKQATPDGTQFAETTVYDDETLTFKILSATRTEDGIAYSYSFQSKTDAALTLAVTNIAVNATDTDVEIQKDLQGNTVFNGTLDLPLSKGEAASKVSLHLEVTTADRWYTKTLVSRDLVFYPVAQSTATATNAAA